MKIHFKSHRKKSWPANALLYNISKLWYRRDPRLWVFGTHEGMKYDDNARYLFEHVNREHGQEIRCVWLAANEEVADTVRKTGGEAYTFDSEEGRKTARRAGVAIYTNGLDDFGPWPKTGGAKLVFLGHGVGFKQTYNAKYSGTALIIKKMMDKIFSWIQRDLTIATSEFNKSQRISIASLPSHANIAITGQPRNDIFRQQGLRKKVFKALGLQEDQHLILYLPTYRSQETGNDSLKNIILNLCNSTELHYVLVKTDSVFVAKLHPLTPSFDIPENDRFRIMNYQEVESNQELLAAGDILVTDYSSVCVDFSLLQRPVIFYLPDKDTFTKNSEAVSDEFYAICKENECFTPAQLSSLISNPSLSATDAINALFESPGIKGSCYSENVFQTINQLFCQQ